MAFKRVKGSITIYSTLVFTVIISLILILAESARISGTRAKLQSRIIMASNSVLADYEREIYDNYRIFAYDGKSNDLATVKEEISDSIKEYMALDGAKWQQDFSQASLDVIDINEIIGMTENSGQVFMDEVIEYMKYKVPAQLSTEFLEMLGLLQRNKKKVEIVKSKSAVEAKIYDCRAMLLELAQQVDGICYENGVYARDEDGDLLPCKAFAKMLVVHMKDKESVGINNDFVYECMKDGYYDVGKELDVLIEKLQWLNDNFEKYDEESDKVYDECQEIIYSIEEKSKLALEGVETSLAFIEKIEKDADEIELEMESFNKQLSGAKDSLESEIYKELEEENKSLLQQPLSNLGGIKERLEKNKGIIIKLTQVYNCNYGYSEENIKEAYDYAVELKGALKEYRVDDIRFDYSGVKREIPEKKDSSLKGLKEVIDIGIARICISDYDKLSKNKLTDSGLVSSNLNSDDSSNLSTRMEKLISSPKEMLSDMVGKLMDALEGEMDVKNILSKTTEEIMEEIVFAYYIGEYFTSLTNVTTNTTIKHTLAYEQEYIIIGERADRGNVKGIVKRLLGIRMAMNFICILGDGTCRQQALGVATSLTGIFGIPAITYLVSTIVQIIWAYEEATVDVCAITQGRYVPIIKTSASMKVQATKILTFEKATVEKLARMYSTTDSPTDYGYDEYLRLFIILLDDEVAAARTMDLIQSNINKTYNKKINFARLICGWDVEAVFNIKNMFSKLPIIQAIVKGKEDGYEIKIISSNVY